MDGDAVINAKGYDSGVLDVGDGYVVTAHIESHNHPSAVEPYGGAATGVGGVIRDILSTGTRPIAILDGLRFGDVENDPHARWLLRNAVSGIADYGNCLGIPTIGGEVEFDECYTGYALVDVAAIGFGKKERLIRNHAEPGDLVVLMGGPTGRDGIGGSQFASDSLDGSGDRSAVQIPDPFIEKLIIEAFLEARDNGLIHAVKDLGGGGLSCALSETADALGVGMDADVAKVHTREPGMSPDEIMISESQERMLLIIGGNDLPHLKEICSKFRIGCSVIGEVRSGGMGGADNPDAASGTLRITHGPEVFAELPVDVVANPTLLELPSKRPQYLDQASKPADIDPLPADYTCTLQKLLLSPNISSRRWVYEQYDHEVGIRTVVRPGRDASVLRLDNGRYLSISIDANPKHCHVNPRQGAMGCFEEACRNVVCTGAKPAAMLDHLQFGDPTNPEVFWTFLESLRGIADLATHLNIPCIGGKVSLYNETDKGPIKPTPVIGVLGLTSKKPFIAQNITSGDNLVLVGSTGDEMGGSEYIEYIHGIKGGGKCPAVDPATSAANAGAVLGAIDAGLVRCAHDCSKGGLAVAISEMCLAGNVGCSISVKAAPVSPETKDLAIDKVLFSESHCRYLLAVHSSYLAGTQDLLQDAGVPFAVLGTFGGDNITFQDYAHTKHNNPGSPVIDLRVDKTRERWLNKLKELCT